MKQAYLIPLLLLLLCGCATLTPSQKLLWMEDVYLAEYNKYYESVLNPTLSPEGKAQLKADTSLILPEHLNPALTEGQRKVLRVKKEILIELKPVVEMAVEYHTTGKLPTNDMQSKLTELINKLIALSGD